VGERCPGGDSQHEAVSDNAAGGKRRHVRETQSRVPRLSNRTLRNLTVIAAITISSLAAAPAFAGTDHPTSDITRDVVNFLGLHADQKTTTGQVISFFGFGPNQANNPTDPQPVAEPAKQEVGPREIAPVQVTDVGAPPRLPAAVAAEPSPSVETPLHRLFCVEYARMRSGLSVFGDARHWWDRAKNVYARMSRPVEEAVMVFSGSKRLKRGHVAVVTEIVSPRQIIVDQANWENHGEIDHATPILDVSRDNDWSQVRVWDMRSGTFGAHVYAISGFISKSLATASND
jgi:hypothetical protein